ncbi:MAG: ABC transporter substrate-binding protein, partial [Propionicimonas sp.]
MPERPSTARVFIGEPSSIDPCNGFEHDGALILRFLADPLVDFDPATGAPHPAAAQGWEISDDGREITFQLRPTVRFHHGRTVNAEDYVYSLSRLVRPETGSKLAYHLAMVEGFQDVREGRSDVLSGVTALSPEGLRVRLTEPFYEVATVFGHRATAAVPRELAEGDPERFRAQPVSTGPYRVVEPWRPGVGLALERSEVYHGANEAFRDGGAGHLQRIDFRIYEELEDAYRDWHAGELDVVKVPPSRIPDALPLGERFRRTPCALMQYLGFPTGVPPFDDPQVRRAVSMAVDRQALIDSAFSGTRPLAQRILPPALVGDDADLTGVSYDPVAARALIDSLGVEPVVTDFAFNAGLGHDGWVTELVKQVNAALGWSLTPRPMAWPEFLKWVGSADTLFRMTWAIDYPSVDNFLYPLFHSASIGDDNFTGYNEPEVDALIDAARATADEDRRRELYAAVEARVCRELPLLPLWLRSGPGARDQGQESVREGGPRRAQGGLRGIRAAHLLGHGTRPRREDRARDLGVELHPPAQGTEPGCLGAPIGRPRENGCPRGVLERDVIVVLDRVVPVSPRQERVGVAARRQADGSEPDGPPRWVAAHHSAHGDGEQLVAQTDPEHRLLAP